MVTLSPETVLPNDTLAPHQGQSAVALIAISKKGRGCGQKERQKKPNQYA